MEQYIQYLRETSGIDNSLSPEEYLKKDFFKTNFTKKTQSLEEKYSYLIEKTAEYYLGLPKVDITKYTYEGLKVISFLLSNHFKDKKYTPDYFEDEDVLFFGITFKQIVGTTKKTRLMRLKKSSYIYSKLEAQKASYSENYLFDKEGGHYCSSYAVESFKRKERKRQEYLDNTYIRFNDNYAISMTDMHEVSQQSKMNEIYMINSMLDNNAQLEGRVWLMSTITLPRKFHINPVKGKKSYDKTLNTLDGDKALTATYRAAYNHLRKDLERNKIEDFYGVWSKEPHKNGSIHMHILFYVLPNEVNHFKKRFTSATNNLFKKHGEKTKKGVSVNFKVEDKAKGGKGSTYLFKYIMKSLNVMEFKPEGKERIKIENADKIAAHNSMFNYKRFSFVGVKSCLSKWRVVRQVAKHLIKKLDIVGLDFKPHFSDNIHLLFNLALNNNYKDFMALSEALSLDYTETENEYGENIKTIIGFTLDNQEFEKPKAQIEKRTKKL